MRHLDIDALSVLVAVSRRQSFSAAAREIGRSQAAVSFTVARLEEQVDARLFDRNPRGVFPTPAGAILVAYAHRMIALQDEALEAIHRDRGHGRVRFGLPDDYMDWLAQHVLPRFAAAYPGVQVEITCDFSRRLELAVEAGDLDLAVITRDRRFHVGEKLRDEPQLWCTGKDARPERDAILPVALFNDQCRARPMILDALESSGRPWRLAFTSTHLHGICAAMDRGAVAVLPASCVPPRFRILDSDAGLPDLPPLELALLLQDGANVTARRLAHVVRATLTMDQQACESVAATA